MSIRDLLFSCISNPGFGLAKVPLRFIEETYLESVLGEVNRYVFCRVFQSALSEFKDRFIPEPILKFLLKFDYEFLEKYIDNFPEYFKLFEVMLATFIASEEVHFKVPWKRRLVSALENPIPRLLNGEIVPIDEKLSPSIFFLPQQWVKKLFEIDEFSSSWLLWDNDPSIYHHVFRRLRNRLYELRQSSASLKMNYPMVVLRNLTIMIEKHENLGAYNYASDEIVSLATALVNDAMERW